METSCQRFRVGQEIGGESSCTQQRIIRFWWWKRPKVTNYFEANESMFQNEIHLKISYRFYRKPRSRDKDQDPRSNYGHARYSSATRGEDYEYDDGVDYDDEDEHYRDVRRKDRNTTFADRRKHDSDRSMESMHRMTRSNRDVYFQMEKDRLAGKYDPYEAVAKGRPSSRREREFNYETYEDTPHPNIGSKFNFEAGDQGFESDFNAAPEKNLRFSTDFSGEKDNARVQQHQLQQQSPHPTSVSQPSPASGSEHVPTPPQQKLRFDDKITVSKFDLFDDDDFSKAEFSFENEDQWVDELPKKINLKNVNNSSGSSQIKRHEHIKKSESVNIFAKKQDDPFEDDDFFKKSSPEQNSCSNNSKKNGIHNNNSSSNRNNSHIERKSDFFGANNNAATAANNNASYKWENNFAKFDENIWSAPSTACRKWRKLNEKNRRITTTLLQNLLTIKFSIKNMLTYSVKYDIL